MQIDFAIQSVSEASISPHDHEYALKPIQTEKLPIEKTAETTKSENKKSENKEKESDLQKVQQKLADYDIALNFSRDLETNILVVKMINNKTGEAIKQIPSEVSVKLAAELGKLQGLIFKQNA